MHKFNNAILRNVACYYSDIHQYQEKFLSLGLKFAPITFIKQLSEEVKKAIAKNPWFMKKWVITARWLLEADKSIK